MKCIFDKTDEVQNDRRLWRCRREGCRQQSRGIWVPINLLPRDSECTGRPLADDPLPKEPVGTELHNIIAALGITPDASCGCEAWRLKLNAWGVEGCQEHRQEIIEHLRKAYASTDWKQIARASVAAIQYPRMCFEALLGDPCNALLDEALRRTQPSAAPASSAPEMPAAPPGGY